MKIYVPSYYNKFKCIADKCTDNCCIGWGIDVDPDTVNKYKSLPPEPGEEILASIDFSEGASFKCDSCGRCANLDERGLCRIISNLGEEYLCQICRDHPRYFNLVNGRCEGGVGIACEVGADLVLSIDSMPEIQEIDSPDEVEDFSDVSPLAASARDHIFNLLFSADDVNSLYGSVILAAEALDDLLFDALCGEVDEALPFEGFIYDKKVAPELDFSAIFRAFNTIEPLIPDFNEKLAKAENFASQNGDELMGILADKGRVPMRNLTYYFIHRYFLSTEFSYRECALFAVGSAALILTLAHLSDGITHENLISEAKYFSKNIEYSTENVEIVLENLTE